jgi:hypothetical protein
MPKVLTLTSIGLVSGATVPPTAQGVTPATNAHRPMVPGVGLANGPCRPTASAAATGHGARQRFHAYHRGAGTGEPKRVE